MEISCALRHAIKDPSREANLAMIWNFPQLELSEISPSRGSESSENLRVKASGHGFKEGISLMLLRSSRVSAPNLAANEVMVALRSKITNGNSGLEFELCLRGIEPGNYDAIVWTPPDLGSDGSDAPGGGEVYIREKAFEVVKDST